MDDKTLKSGYRRGWLLWGLAVLFIVVFFMFVLDKNEPGKKTEWDMGGKSFVPASSPYANGYYLPVEKQNEKKGDGK